MTAKAVREWKRKFSEVLKKKVKDILRKLMLLYKRFLYFLAKLVEKRDDKMVVFEFFREEMFRVTQRRCMKK